MNHMQHMNDDAHDDPFGATPEDAETGMQPRELDSALIEEPFEGASGGSHADDLARVQVGAEVYAADGEEVAVVEMVAPGHVGVRAGQPGRTIDLPPEAIARVSPDGQRVDITLSSAQVEQFAGGEQTGADHLEGQQSGGE